MKAVLVADPHLKTTDKYGKVLPSGLNSRLQDRLDHLTKSVEYAIENGVEYWICTGDVFDRINPAEILRQNFIHILAPLIEHKIKIIIIIGNHDTDFKVFSFMTESVLLNTLRSEALTIISEPAEMTLGNVECLMLPFDTDENISEQLLKYENKVVFGHFGVDGALVSGTEFILSSGIKQGLFDRHRFSYLGHYHKNQKTSKWMYIGSIAKVDFGERNDKKGFIYLEADAENIRHKFIDVHDRLFIQYTVDQESDPDFNPLSIWENLEGSVIKLIFVGEEDWFLKFNMGEIRSLLLKKLGAHKHFIGHQTKYEHRVRVPEIDASSSWDEGIEVLCKRHKRPDMIELGKSILQEVI